MKLYFLQTQRWPKASTFLTCRHPRRHLPQLGKMNTGSTRMSTICSSHCLKKLSFLKILINGYIHTLLLNCSIAKFKCSVNDRVHRGEGGRGTITNSTFHLCHMFTAISFQKLICSRAAKRITWETLLLIGTSTLDIVYHNISRS